MSEKIPFPEAPIAQSKPRTNALDKVRHCPKCGGETRIVANDLGVAAFCGPCDMWYPVSAAGTSSSEMPMVPGRGISKHVYLDSSTDESWKESPPKDDDEIFIDRRRYETGK